MFNKRMKTVIITGAAGFLGNHLVKRYMAEGWLVIGIDDFCTSLKNSSLFLENKKSDRFLFIEGDVRDTQHWQRIIKNSAITVDLILNFACPASPPRYQAIPIKTLLTCVNGTQNALDAARFFNCPIVQASTSEVYGDPTITPQEESYRGNVNCFGIRSNYDEGKRCAEALIFDYIHQYQVDARIVRIFNTYGPGMDPEDGRVVSNMICQSLQNQPMTVFGDGNQTRSFCYVSDLIEAIYRVSQLKQGTLTSPVNIGNENTFTIKELALTIAKVLNITPKISYKDLPGDDPLSRKPDLTKARQVLNNWEATIQLEEGLKNTIPWFKQILKV
jgi:UDP-glucuronate decarboxylase